MNTRINIIILIYKLISIYYICWRATVQRYLSCSSMAHGFIFPITFSHAIFFFANPAKIGRRDAQNPTGMRLLAVDQICIKK